MCSRSPRARAVAGWRVILGGPEPANYAEEYLGAGADVIVAGEGEIALEELAATDFDPAIGRRSPALSFAARTGDRDRTGPRTLIADSRRPALARSRAHRYRTLSANAGANTTARGSLSVITARGCPYHCNWCSHSVYGKTHRRRSPRSVADEVEWILDRYQPDMLWMADDVFTIHPRLAARICGAR